MATIRNGYKSDLDDETYAFMLPFLLYLLLRPEDASQRTHPLCEVLKRWSQQLTLGCNVLGKAAPPGPARWECLPHDFPPPESVRQQAKRWFNAGYFENLLHDLRVMVRLQEGRAQQPIAMILDSRTPQSTPESGSRAGCNDYRTQL